MSLSPAEAIELELLNYSFWEHYKAAKDLALTLPLEHPRRRDLQAAIAKIQPRIHELQALDKAQKEPDVMSGSRRE